MASSRVFVRVVTVAVGSHEVTNGGQQGAGLPAPRRTLVAWLTWPTVVDL